MGEVPPTGKWSATIGGLFRVSAGRELHRERWLRALSYTRVCGRSPHRCVSLPPPGRRPARALGGPFACRPRAPSVPNRADNSGQIRLPETGSHPPAHSEIAGQRPFNRVRTADSQAQSASSILVTCSTKEPQASGRGFFVVWTGSGISCHVRARCLVIHGFTPPPHEQVEAGRKLALPLQVRKADRTTTRMPASDVVAPSARLPVAGSAARLAQTVRLFRPMPFYTVEPLPEGREVRPHRREP